jgi:hypothetical protein
VPPVVPEVIHITDEEEEEPMEEEAFSYHFVGSAHWSSAGV